MKRFKEHWEIQKNWQLIFPILGILASALCAFLIAKRFTPLYENFTPEAQLIILISTVVIGTWIIIKLSLWIFTKLEGRWIVDYRWEFIAIFLCFAVTGSTAGKISDPLMELICLARDTTNGWIYWPVRILLIFPIYQVLLVIFGWLFGQYAFFKAFAIKMVSRLGIPIG